MRAVQMSYKAFEKRWVGTFLATVALFFSSGLIMSGDRWESSVRWWALLWALMLGIFIGRSFRD